MKIIALPIAITTSLCALAPAHAQSEQAEVKKILSEQILPRAVAIFQLRDHVLERLPPAPRPISSEDWGAQSAKARSRLLNDVILHGWPQTWVDAHPKFQEVGLVQTPYGYRLRKLRYEIAPGMQSTALLYEPDRLTARAPAVLHLNGHYYRTGKASEWKQKLSINLAKRGVLVLDLEWLGCGELSQEAEGQDATDSPPHKRKKRNEHWDAGALDLIGANAAGLFYLAMRRGLDYLSSDPRVDPGRIGVTGQSGGGWQSIMLGALDARVGVAVPVSGFSAAATKIEARDFGDLGDLEQNATDLLKTSDYTTLAALRAPRPTLLIYSAEDDCCFRGPLVKPLVFDAIKPIFRLFGKEDAFRYHENVDPGNHNAQHDIRLATYRFFARHFNLPAVDAELLVGQELRSYDELAVGLPKNNLSILGLSRAMAKDISREPPSRDPARLGAQRQLLRSVLRYQIVGLKRPWLVANTRSKGLESKSYLFAMDNGLSADGVWIRSASAPDTPDMTIILNDQGKAAASDEVVAAVSRDESALALDLALIGDAWTNGDDKPPWNVWGEPDLHLHAQLLGAVGERPLGIEAAQLLTVARFFKKDGRGPLKLEATGPRSQAIALAAAALEPGIFSQVTVHEGMRSLQYVLDHPLKYREAPELFCLDLYKHFDLDHLTVLAAPARVKTARHLEDIKR